MNNLYWKLDYSLDYHFIDDQLFNLEFPIYKELEGRVCLNLHREWY